MFGLGTIINTVLVILGGAIGLLFKKGEIVRKIKEDELIEELIREIKLIRSKTLE